LSGAGVYNIYIENARAGFYVPSIGDKRPAFFFVRKYISAA